MSKEEVSREGERKKVKWGQGRQEQGGIGKGVMGQEWRGKEEGSRGRWRVGEHRYAGLSLEGGRGAWQLSMLQIEPELTPTRPCSCLQGKGEARQGGCLAAAGLLTSKGLHTHCGTRSERDVRKQRPPMEVVQDRGKLDIHFCHTDKT